MVYMYGIPMYHTRTYTQYMEIKIHLHVYDTWKQMYLKHLNTCK